jgi:hypothetical protein
VDIDKKYKDKEYELQREFEELDKLEKEPLASDSKNENNEVYEINEEMRQCFAGGFKIEDE